MSRGRVAATDPGIGAPRRTQPLETLFSLCLGIVLAVVMGVSVTTLRPDPAEGSRAQLESLAAVQLRAQVTMSRDEQIALEERIRDLRARARAQEDVWSTEVGSLVVALSSVVMVGSLVAIRRGSTRVIRDGVLLAGALSMVYGVILMLMSAQTWLRFAVLVTAGLVTAAVGRARFAASR